MSNVVKMEKEKERDTILVGSSEYVFRLIFYSFLTQITKNNHEFKDL